VRIDFISFLRDTRKFANAEELTRQLEQDREDALCALTPFIAPGNLNGYPGTVNFTQSVA
jgi:hypothetical protein